MKRFIFCIVSKTLFLIFFLNFVFGQDTGLSTDNVSGSTIDSGENAVIEQDSGLLITNSGQDGQLLDTNFNTGTTLSSGVENTNSGLDLIDISYGSQNNQTNGNEESFDSPNIFISEVFFDGSNERIELYNNSLEFFSGDIDILGASSSTKTVTNLNIEPQNTAILADTNIDSILDTSYVFNSNMGFSISDTSAINISLQYSGQEIDNFQVDETIVSSLDNKISFHKYIDTQNIVSTSLSTTQNTTTGYLANPGFVFNEIIPPSDPELKITEVYFDQDDEWFEITNIGDQDFSGSISLSGNLNFDISTNIASQISKVFANNIYTMFQTGTNIQTISDPIDFDTGQINLDLIWSGQILDNFYADETQVQYYDQANTSFEKIGQGSSWTTTVVGLNLDRYFNTNWGIAANPTKVFNTGENLIDVTQAREQESYDQPLPIDCDDFRDTTTANISEVYYGNDLYPAYVELRAQDNIFDYYPYIMIEGTAISGSVAFDTSEMYFKDRILISSSSKRYDEGRNSVYDDNFSLTTGGRLTLYGRDDYEFDRQILDIIYLNGGVLGNSLYAGNQTNQCADVFDYQDKFSPGLTIGQSQYIDISPDPVVQYIYQGGGGCSSSQKQTFNSDNPTKNIEISTIKYTGDLQILKLKNKNSSDINLRDYKIQTLDGKTQTIKGNTLFANTTMSFVGNYGLPTNQDYCINLIKNDEVVDRYCRNSISKSSEQDDQNILNQLSFWIDEQEAVSPSDPIENPINPLQTNEIKIMDIDYNPDGSDINNETISLMLTSGDQVDLSNYKIQYIKDEKSHLKTIKGVLSKGNVQIFKGNYTFPNSTNDKKPVTVNLINSNNYIVDTYIYNPNKITEIPDGNYKVVSVIDGDTVKILYSNQEFNIRLAGIDAPESNALRCGKIECFGPESKEFLSKLLEGKQIYFQQTSMDDFDRFVGYVFLNDENINQKLIKNGFAREYSYKDQNYEYQSEFKSAQKYAKDNKLGLWSAKCNGQRLCPVDETQADNLIINIQSVIYDPEGLDTNNEEITISMVEGHTIEFSKNYYLLINDNKKYLSDFGSISPGETKTLKGTFGFPNSKKTTISFTDGNTIFDAYVYDPQLDKLLDKKEELTNTGTKIEYYQSGIDIKIVSILPDLLGKDSLGEQIGLLYSGIFESINLSSGYYLKIGSTKKYLNGQLISNQETLLTGNFALPNKAACVEIGFETKIFDKFCYTDPKEGERFFKTNGILDSISTINLDILQDSKLTNVGNKVCLTYQGQSFDCKNMPYSKLSTQKINQNKLYKQFFDIFEEYLKNERTIMYYDTEIKNYFNLLNAMEKSINDGKTTFQLDGKIYNLSEFESLYQQIYSQDTKEIIQKALLDFVPEKIRNKYQDWKIEYIEYLMQQ